MLNVIFNGGVGKNKSTVAVSSTVSVWYDVLLSHRLCYVSYIANISIKDFNQVILVGCHSLRIRGVLFNRIFIDGDVQACMEHVHWAHDALTSIWLNDWHYIHHAEKHGHVTIATTTTIKSHFCTCRTPVCCFQLYRSCLQSYQLMLYTKNLPVQYFRIIHVCIL